VNTGPAATGGDGGGAVVNAGAGGGATQETVARSRAKANRLRT